MEMNGFKRVLWELSIEYFKANNTVTCKFNYGSLIEDLYTASRRRNIIGDLQLFEVFKSSGFTEAIFMFSPNYLNRKDEMLFSGMGDIKWKLLLPIVSGEPEVDDDTRDTAEIADDIAEKLAHSSVEILHQKLASDFDLDTFKKSLSRT